MSQVELFKDNEKTKGNCSKWIKKSQIATIIRKGKGSI